MPQKNLFDAKPQKQQNLFKDAAEPTAVVKPEPVIVVPPVATPTPIPTAPAITPIPKSQFVQAPGARELGSIDAASIGLSFRVLDAAVSCKPLTQNEAKVVLEIRGKFYVVTGACFCNEADYFYLEQVVPAANHIGPKLDYSELHTETRKMYELGYKNHQFKCRGKLWVAQGRETTLIVFTVKEAAPKPNIVILSNDSLENPVEEEFSLDTDDDAGDDEALENEEEN